MGLRARTARVSATERFVGAASRRGPSPVVWLLLGIGACFVLAAAMILFSPPEQAEAAFDARIEATLAEIARLESDGAFDAAATRLDGLVREASGLERHRTRVPEWRARARSDRELAADLRKADAEFAEWRSRAEKAGKDDLRQLWEEGQRLRNRVAGTNLAWKRELDVLLSAIERRMAPTSVPWRQVRDRIAAECRLDRRGEADWSRALRLWQEYLAGSVGADDRSGAEAELRSIQARVREDFALVRSRIERLRAEGRSDDARAEVAKQRPRFKGTAAEAELEAVVR